ncbi:MAG: hypothetical protein KU38_06720 [Sulfurovum sp. FS08-3]|nr:MAG: hypothetical protein KU38_06720 [Sulfurovum sp. FS08-3]
MRQVILKGYEDLAQNIESYFTQSTQILHKARNEIGVVEFKGEKLAIKSFKKPNFITKMAYALGKISKAQKSYQYALKISEFTPEPIGYVEFYRYGFLERSYFIARYCQYDFTIREVLLDHHFPHRQILFKAFALFTKTLHEQGILHDDYSPGNILIKQEDNQYTFKIVDINRMRFKPLSRNDRLQNFAKLWANDDDLQSIIGYYSDNPNDKQIAIQYSKAHKRQKNFKKTLKKIIA